MGTQDLDWLNPFWAVRDFEAALTTYTHAPYAVTVDSCTNAIFLALLYTHQQLRGQGHAKASLAGPFVHLPRCTYVGVAYAARNAGYCIEWVDHDWEGVYEIPPTPVVDAAKRFTSGMYQPGKLMCVSFQAYKHLPIGRGGAILTDSLGAAEWLRRARFDGRDPRDEDTGHPVGYHMYLDPPSASRGLWLMRGVPRTNPDFKNDHVDISKYRAFAT